MNTKNISNYLFITLFIFLFSCKSIEILSQKDEIDNDYKEIKETFSTIDLFDYSSNNLQVEDFYNDLHNIKWDSRKEFIKMHTFKSFGSNYQNNKPLISFIYENKFISLNYESKLNIYNLENFKIINSIDLKIKSSINTFYPTSIARVNDNFFVSYSDGKIINFDLQKEK